MDLSYFDELERKVQGVMDRLERLRAENRALQDRIRELETAVQQVEAENGRLQAGKHDIDSHQRDLQREMLLRKKVEKLLGKLDDLTLHSV